MKFQWLLWGSRYTKECVNGAKWLCCCKGPQNGERSQSWPAEAEFQQQSDQLLLHSQQHG